MKQALKVFIGSSHEAGEKGIVLEIARLVEKIGHKPVPWLSPDVFRPGDHFLLRLNEITVEVDAAVFIFREDDSISRSGVSTFQTRDNVLIEWGMFQKALGIKNVAIVKTGNPSMPSDVIGIKYIEFNNEKPFAFEADLNDWLRGIHKPVRSENLGAKAVLEQYEKPIPCCTHSKLEKRVCAILNSMANTQIQISSCVMNPVNSLYRTARQGKALRIVKHHLGLDVRSVLDHILSIAHNAQYFIKEMKAEYPEKEVETLASLIVFHDMCEILTGDFAAFTDYDEFYETKDSVFRPRTNEELAVLEKTANAYLMNFFDNRLRDFYAVALHKLEHQKDPLAKIMCVLDKSDPIIAIWRYVYIFRDNPDFKIDIFLDAMSDFFRNPRVVEQCQLAGLKSQMCGFLTELLIADNAEKYAEGTPNVLEDLARKSRISPTDAKGLIEGRNIEFVR